MKAYIYGKITSSGTLLSTASSSGFTVYSVSTGRYRITFSNAINVDSYIVTATPFSSSTPKSLAVVQNTNYFDIYVWDLISNTLTDTMFNFVVYKK